MRPLADPCHILLAGDWHAHTNYARRVLQRRGAQADVVVHLGDFGYSFTRSFVRAVDEAAARAGTTVLFIRGNHDNPEYLHALPRSDDGLAWLGEHLAWIPDGHRWTWSGLSFLAVGGAVSIDRSARTPGASWWPGETVPLRAMAEFAGQGEVDVLLTHDAPTGVHIPTGGISGWPQADLDAAQTYRDALAELAAAVRPRYLWHGHWHCRYTAEASFGGRACRVTGLDCDGKPFDGNTDLVDLAMLCRPR